MFPLFDRQLTPNAGYNAWRTDPRTGRRFRHEAQDYKGSFVRGYMPFQGWASQKGANNKRSQGGLWFYAENDDVRIEMAHNSIILAQGWLAEGTPAFITGNSGYLSSGPHLHVQIFFKKTEARFDPEDYHWYLPTKHSPNYMFARNEQGEIALIYKRKDGVTVKMPIGGDRYKALGEPQFIQVTNTQYSQWIAVPAWT